MAIAHEREYPVVYFDNETSLARIRKGAIVAQNDGYFTWEDDTIVFVTRRVNTERTRFRLTAKGYGDTYDQGEGHLFASEDDLLPL